jgi:multicomponent K+:H+ antiporter subunit C
MIAWLLASGIGVLTATGVWLLLRARTFDVPLGLTLLSYAVNLFIFVMGRVAFGVPPIIREGVPPTLAHYADPLPQALVLTAIVISFAMTALLLALALKARFVNGSDLCDAEPGDETPAVDLGEAAPVEAAPGGGRR